MKHIVKIPIYLSMYLVYIIYLLIPKDKNLWVFGSQFGDAFVGNSKYLFRYIAKNKKNIRTVWLSRNRSVLRYLKSSGFEAYSTYSFKGFYYSMKASAVIFSAGFPDINKFIPYDSHTKIVQLWHGSPIKKCMHDDPHSLALEKNWVRFIVSRVVTKVFPFLREHYDLVIASSDMIRKRLSSVLNTPLDKVVVTGYPRDDVLIDHHSFSKIFNNLKRSYDFKYLILYLPTYRGEAHSVSNIFNLLNEKYPFNVDRFDKFLTQIKGLFLIRVHPLSRVTDQNLIDKINKSQRIKLLLETPVDEFDIYPLLKHTDILITDYSSVYCDFLLLNRPVIFASFDLKEYITNDKGFYDGYREITAGPIASDWDEVIEYLKEAINDPKEYDSKRKRVNEFFNAYNDANNSERVYNEIMRATHKMHQGPSIEERKS